MHIGFKDGLGEVITFSIIRVEAHADLSTLVSVVISVQHVRVILPCSAVTAAVCDIVIVKTSSSPAAFALGVVVTVASASTAG